MDVYKDSNGDFVCKICQKTHSGFQDALDCASSHKEETTEEIEEASMDRKEFMAKYEQLMEKDTIQVGKSLCLSMIEDYGISRERDLNQKGYVGALTLNLAKSAFSAVADLNKTIYGDKNVNINVDGKKSDLDALKSIVEKKVEVIEDKSEVEVSHGPGADEKASGLDPDIEKFIVPSIKGVKPFDKKDIPDELIEGE